MVNQVLTQQYGWEVDPNAHTTWRIGDETACFYNFAYSLLAGFSEHDTLRSNQVREGVIDRSEALQLAQHDNIPNIDAINGYLAKLSMTEAEVARSLGRCLSERSGLRN